MARPRFLELLHAVLPNESTDQVFGDPPDDDSPVRDLVVCEPPDAALTDWLDIEEARAMIDTEIAAYLADPAPRHILVVKAPPGTGKTRRGVRSAEMMHCQGKRVLYAGPRHEFFQDILQQAEMANDWYEWLPRRGEDPVKHIEATCQYPSEINAWLSRGWDGMGFCKAICGFDYIKGACIYHRQKLIAQSMIVYGQHQHVVSGHPLPFDVVIGDESPQGAFCKEWAIPGRFVVPEGMDQTEELTEVLENLRRLVQEKARLSGPLLLNALGGPDRVLSALENIERLPFLEAPSIHQPDEVTRHGYNHFQALVIPLHREALATKEGREFPHRVIAHDGRLLILGRSDLNEKMPNHIVWLDATADEFIYRKMFGRNVRMVAPRIKPRGRFYQVWERANGVGSLRKDERINQLRLQVQRIKSFYRGRVGVITFKSIESEIADDVTHFYGSRGTNRFEDVEALIVAGVPQPPLHEIDRVARMLYVERMRPFGEWTVQTRPYQYISSDGTGRSYPMSGFWNDPEVNAILWQYRSAELIQSAHRARPNLREVDVWLLANLPVDELPPTALIRLSDLFGSPLGVDVWRWQQLADWLERRWQRGMDVHTQDMTTELQLPPTTASRYMPMILKAWPTKWRAVACNRDCPHGKRRGRPSQRLIPVLGGEGPSHRGIIIAGRVYEPVNQTNFGNLLAKPLDTVIN